MSMRITSFNVETQSRSQFVEITRKLSNLLGDTPVRRGKVTVYVPHTTAAVTINENADPDVVHDILAQLDAMVPWEQPFYTHGEGNSAAHVKASMMGSSVEVPVQHGQLMLGKWQGVFLCEFDGPRTRQVQVIIDGVKDPD